MVINRFSLVKAAMNAPCVCKLRKNCFTVIDQCATMLKTPQFLHFSKNIFQVRNEFSLLLSKLVPQLSILKQGGVLLIYRAFRGWGIGGFF
jgi:hypothetical protein